MQALQKRLKIFAAAGLVAAAFAPFAAQAADVGAEITNAATHAGLAAQSADIAGVQMHLHHTLNCLVGPNGKGFDATQLNPCKNNGNGAIPDTADAVKKEALQTAAAVAAAGIAATNITMAQADAKQTASMLQALK